MTARLIIAGTHSGVGKTSITAGLIAALRQRGLTIQPFKAGPDYIDPSYHSLAADRPCRNLDTWMVPLDHVRTLFSHASRQADVAVIEGVMGLYDGFGYKDDSGSTAQVAKLLETPVVLVLDSSHMARSAGALALGYSRFDPTLSLAGFLVNQVAGEKHGQGVATAIQDATGLPVLGWLPRNPDLEIPERHLGLVPTAEPGRWRAFIEAAAALVTHHIDLDRLLAIAQKAPNWEAPDPMELLAGDQDLVIGPPPAISVAQDEAFSFTYPDNLDLLRVAGAEITSFSPLTDETLPPETSAVILSGGFPELYAGQLSSNTGMRQALRRAHQQGVPIYAECGGLMYLTETITDMEGHQYPMVGLLPGHSTMSGRLTMGYRLAQAQSASWLLAAGETVRGHEFHYSAWEDRPSDLPPAYSLLPPDGQGEPRPEGACLGNTWASYVHLHLWHKPELATRFVAACSRGEMPDVSR
jgi:cobyrinic acid a,c-diamide synthase